MMFFISDRIFWAFSASVAFVVLIFLLFGITSKYLSDRIVIKLSEQERVVTDITFPSLTICPEVLITENIVNDSYRNNTLNVIEWVLSGHQAFSVSFEFHLMIFSSELLRLIHLLYDQSFIGSEEISASTSKLLTTLRNRTQSKWFYNEVKAGWQQKYSVPFQEILTKWGYCFNFNLMSPNDLFHINKLITLLNLLSSIGSGKVQIRFYFQSV